MSNVKRNKILITGGAGFIGHHVVEHFLRNADAELFVLDKLTYASNGYDRLRDVNAYDERRVHRLGCDLAQPIPAGVARELGDIDFVIHLAAESHVDNSIVDPMPFLTSNVIGTHHLLWWARSVPSIKRFFLMSTDEAYGPASWDSPGNVETDPFRPANPYAASKAGAECVAFAYANTYKLPITVASTMNALGERQGSEKYVPTVIRKVLNGETVHIHADPTRTRSGTRFYIHARNIASAYQFLIENHDRCPLKLHIAGEREISNLDLAQLIAGFVGEKLLYDLTDFHSSRPGHDLRYALDGSVIRNMGWQQPMDIDRSLEKTVRWYLEPQNQRWLYTGTLDQPTGGRSSDR
jgi:dTDP-glucose 4,6-dehydratase